jgi:hypothetical protein
MVSHLSCTSPTVSSGSSTSSGPTRNRTSGHRRAQRSGRVEPTIRWRRRGSARSFGSGGESLLVARPVCSGFRSRLRRN